MKDKNHDINTTNQSGPTYEKSTEARRRIFPRLRENNFIPQFIREPLAQIVQFPSLPLPDSLQHLSKFRNRLSITHRLEISPRVHSAHSFPLVLTLSHLQPFPLLRPMRPDIQQPHRRRGARVVMILVAHPAVAHLLHEGRPLAVLLRVGHRQHFYGGGQIVAGLGRHDEVAAAHDSQFKREAHGGAFGLIAAGEGVYKGFPEGVGGRVVGEVVDEVDDVPPRLLNDGEVGFTVFIFGDGDLEFHVSDAHVLDLKVYVS